MGALVSHLNSVAPFTSDVFAADSRLLLQFRADPNARDINDDTPLNWAAMKGNFESVRVLLEYNALPDIISHASMLPITRVGILLAAGLSEDENCFEYIMRAMGEYLLVH